MKNNKIFSTLIICSLFILILIYFLDIDIAVNVNRLMEILFTDDKKGMVMYYHEFGRFSYMVSILAGVMQMIIPPIAKFTVVNANVKFFGITLGILLSYIGIILGLSYSYAIGKTISNIFLKNILKYEFKNKYAYIIVFIISIVWFWPCMFIGYASGVLNINFKKFVSVVAVGKLISLIYLIFI